MLTDMKVKGTTMMEDEKKVFWKYKRWSDKQSRDLAYEIKKSASKIEELTAFASKADSDVAELGRRIKDLEAEIDKLSGEKKAATEDRAEQHAEYLKVSEDYAESVDALERAIQTLSAQSYDRAQAEALLQQMAKSVRGMPRVLASFFQEKGHGALRGDGGAPEVAAYEFQSGGVLTLLKKLLDEFKDKLADTDKDEANQAHAFSMIELHLSNTIAADTSDRDEKAAERGKRAEASAKAKSELAATKADKAASEQLKAETESTFEVKSAAFEENQKVRSAELEAIGKAVEVLSSPEVVEGYAKHISSLAQKPRGTATSFLQMGRSRRRIDSKERVVALLRKRAADLRSQSLAQVASQISANPFDKVVEMIETLLAKLKEEAASEAEHKAWCDEELKANKMKRKKKTAQANKLMAEVENLEVTITELGDTIEKLAKEQAELASAMSEATQLRQEEKAENEVAVKDAKAGSEAVQRAHVVLKDFYASQAAFLQQKQVPEMEAYKGMQRTKGGVMAMLEVIMSDFERLKSETEANENSAAAQYEAFMKESEASQKQKHEAEFKFKLDKDQAEYEKDTAEKDLARTSAALAKANEYFEELKPACVHVHVSFEERTAQRKEEIEALREAYKILDQKSQSSA